MFRRKAEKRMVELSPDEVRPMRKALLAFRNKLLSASIVSADAHHGKCANENLPKSECGSLLKGCRR